MTLDKNENNALFKKLLYDLPDLFRGYCLLKSSNFHILQMIINTMKSTVPNIYKIKHIHEFNKIEFAIFHIKSFYANYEIQIIDEASFNLKNDQHSIYKLNDICLFLMNIKFYAVFAFYFKYKLVYFILDLMDNVLIFLFKYTVKKLPSLSFNIITNLIVTMYQLIHSLILYNLNLIIVYSNKLYISKACLLELINK